MPGVRNSVTEVMCAPVAPGTRYFFCGIGGVGMNPLAHLLRKQDIQVSGSDCSESSVLQALRLNGVVCYVGHDASQVQQSQVFVYSSAIADDNPELAQACESGIPCIHRSDVLAQMVNKSRGVTVAGTHGKTTVSAMTALMFTAGKFDPQAVIGGFVPGFNGYHRAGTGEWIIVESDESDGSFQKFESEIAVVLNIDTDHMDYYDSLEDIIAAFSVYLSKVKTGGAILYNADDPNVVQACQQADISARMKSCSLKQEADFRAKDITCNPWSSVFTVCETEREYTVELGVPGVHNVMNALQAAAAARVAGVAVEAVQSACREFHGVHRRFQVLGSFHGATVIDDYAHHPREIEATLAAAESLGSPVITVFQPHRYSRTEKLMDEFISVLKNVNRLILTDIYSASECSTGMTGRRLYDKLAQARNDITYVENIDMLPECIAEKVHQGDVILCLGAGSISSVAHSLVHQ
jgi:UDP-N-acetylmuramate--alanine ligase